MAETHDYVVVGAGSAGAVLARRLVDAGASVALIEAGGAATNPAIDDPARSHELWFSPEDWAFRTVPQAAAANRELHWPRGKVLGGSSALNGMIVVRGHRADFDGWAMLGCPGWGWEEVLPLFRRSEDFDRGASELHGAGGPLRVITDYPRHPVNEAMVAASVAAGIPHDEDCNDGNPDGVSFAQLAIRDGHRETTATAFLGPIAGEPRLRVITGVTVSALRFAGGRCVGAEGLENGAPWAITASAEVILCAGAIGSPELLLRSGIGPADELRGARDRGPRRCPRRRAEPPRPPRRPRHRRLAAADPAGTSGPHPAALAPLLAQPQRPGRARHPAALLPRAGV